MRCGENLGSKAVVGSEWSVAKGQVASASIATSENPQFSVLRCQFATRQRSAYLLPGSDEEQVPYTLSSRFVKDQAQLCKLGLRGWRLSLLAGGGVLSFPLCPKYEAPIGLWVRGGGPHLVATLRSQKMGGMSVRVVTGQRDPQHSIRSGPASTLCKRLFKKRKGWDTRHQYFERLLHGQVSVMPRSSWRPWHACCHGSVQY